MKRICFSLTVFLVLAALLPELAEADTSFALVGTTSSAQSVGGPSPFGLGAGALIGIGLNPLMSFETGALFFNRSTQLGEPLPGLVLEEHRHVLQLPLLLRLHLLPMVSVGAGVYANIASRDREYSAGGLYAGTSRGGWAKEDYGLLGSAGLSVPILPGCHFLLDARYAHSLGRFSGAGGVGNTREIQGLAGLQFVL